MEDKIPIYAKHSIRDLRVRLGLSQKEAAKKLGVTSQTLQKWEIDPEDMSIKMMDKIAKFYKIPQKYIFFGNNHAFSDVLMKAKIDFVSEL